jgi:hypothetical protein
MVLRFGAFVSGRFDVLVEAEEVRGVVLLLDCCEPLIIGTVGGPDRGLALVTQIIDVGPSAQERLRGPVDLELATSEGGGYAAKGYVQKPSCFCWRPIVAGQLPGEWWGFVLLGVCAGIISGLLGVGSGTVVIPALVLVWGFGQKSAQGMALAIMVPMALVGAIRYWRNPEVELRGMVLVLIVLGALAGTMAGTELAARLPAGLLRKFFAIFLAIVAVRMFTAAPRAEKPPRNAGASIHSPIPKAIDLGDQNESAAQRP